MNQARLVRYAKGKAVRRIPAECGDCDRLGIGVARESSEHPWAVALSFTAPDGRDTQLLINDRDTLIRLQAAVAKLIAEKS